MDLLCVVCDSCSCDPSGLIREKQKVVSCSGRESWKHSAPVPFLKSLSHLSSCLAVPLFLLPTFQTLS